MRRLACVIAIAVFLPGAARAELHGVAVQVSNGKAIPTVAELKIVLAPGDLVRDVLGWHRVDKLCDLAGNPDRAIEIPDTMNTLYTSVAAAGGKNFVTLAFGNKKCGMLTVSGARDFPDTPAQQAEFAAYAVRVVKQVPALGALSVWNELNGTWNGGYTDTGQALAAYCRLSNKVIAEVRKANPQIPISIGATVGWNVGGWFVDMFNTYGCAGRNDPTIWLDVHPYLSGKVDQASGKTDWTLWSENVARIRAAGITNHFMASEWGAKAAYTWTTKHPGGNYVKTFQANVVNPSSDWAGSVWYEMLFQKSTPNAGLFDKSGALTARGSQYVAEFNP